MHYSTPESQLKLAPLQNFLNEMGLGKLEPAPSMNLSSSTIPEETRVIVLSYDH